MILLIEGYHKETKKCFANPNSFLVICEIGFVLFSFRTVNDTCLTYFLVKKL